MKELEKQMKALGNRRRLTILAFLKKVKEANVGDIAMEIKLSFRSTSKHLSVLYAAGIVEKKQEIVTVNYRIAKMLHPATKQVLTFL